jgi:hypothetical protein
MQNQSVAKVEFEIEPRPWQRRAIQRAKIDESRGRFVVNYFAAKTPVTQ